MNPLSKKMSFVCIFLAFIHVSVAQVGIGTAQPDAKAQLDVSSTSKGFLPPRMSYAQRQGITGTIPAGLMIWCNDCGNNGEMQFYNGTSWVTFSATSTSAPISIITNTPTDITNTAANASASVTGLTPTTYGFLYALSNVADANLIFSTPLNQGVQSQSSNFLNNGSFSASLSNLSRNSTYKIRAYVGVMSGMSTNYSYSNILTFTTANNQVLAPQVSTSPAMNITANSASLQGTLTSNGGETPSSVGFQYQTGSQVFTDGNPSANPPVPASYQTVPNSGFGSSISAFLSGLSASTTYYFRAFATNSAGTALGSVESFETLQTGAVPVSLNSATVAPASPGVIMASGSVQTSGGATTITEVGFEYTLSTNPFGVSNTGTRFGVTNPSPATPPFSFNGSSTTLPQGTYLVRAFATTNSNVTSRSSSLTVTIN